jgi:1-acyl-sn-glycerol-3-phosphate acyltransferase
VNWVTQSLYALWGIFAWLVFAIAAVAALLIAILVPGMHRRQRLAAAASRAIFIMAGIRVQVTGIDNLPTDHCIVVANHASYIDGVLLKGYLPGRFSFVIKGEMRNIPVIHFLLRRSGSKFVERNELSGSARDARQLVKAAQDGDSFAFFPEGTFRKERGVGRFRAGAFLAAVRGELPVVSVAISGTRYMLPSGRLLPRPNRLRIDILPAIAPGDEAFSDSRALAEAARQRILTVLDEPDLVPRSGDEKELPTN